MAERRGQGQDQSGMQSEEETSGSARGGADVDTE